MTALPGEPETDAGTAGVSEAASAQADQVLRLLAAAEGAGLPLWLSGGWAIDARLNRVTREHGDIDVAFPRERESGLVSLLQSTGPFSLERTDYGFLARSGTLLVDCEPCVLAGSAYEIDGPPAGSCPWDRQGVIAGTAVRCVSWEAILWDYFHYLEEVPRSGWAAKDLAGYALARTVHGVAASNRLHAQFQTEYTA